MSKSPELIEEAPTFRIRAGIVYWTEGDEPKAMPLATARITSTRLAKCLADHDAKKAAVIMLPRKR